MPGLVPTRCLLLAAACTVVFGHGRVLHAERDRAQTWAWLESNAPVDDSSSPFLVAMIADRHAFDVESSFREAATAAFAAEPLSAAFASLIGEGSLDPGAPDALGPWQRPLAAALACPQRPLQARDFVGALERDNVDVYAVAHAVLGLTWSAERGCLAPEDVAAARCIAEGALRSALAARPHLDDARAELLAIALYAGADELVSAADIEAVEASFASDGSWGPSEADNRYHATMVAAWATAEWSSRDESLPSLVARAPRGVTQPPFLVAPAAALGCTPAQPLQSAQATLSTGSDAATAPAAPEPPARAESGCAGWR